MHPGFGITRIRFNGYNLSLIVRHPFEISTAKVIKRFGKSGAVCEEFVKIAIRPDRAAVRRFRKAGNAVTRDIYPCCCVTADNFYLRIRPARSFSSARASACPALSGFPGPPLCPPARPGLPVRRQCLFLPRLSRRFSARVSTSLRGFCPWFRVPISRRREPKRASSGLSLIHISEPTRPY